MKKLNLLGCSSLVALSLAATTAPALAQEEGANSGVRDVIVVTTTRRETNLFDTVGAISAISGEDLQTRGIQNVTNIDNLVPNLKIQDQTSQGVGAIQITLRGIGNSSFIEIGDPNVALHVDGVYASRPQAALNLLFDAQRMEVARGPQGTLYGRNATVGSINIVNNRPDTDDFTGGIGLDVGDYNQRAASGVLNIPVIEDVFALRAAAFFQTRDSQYTLLEDDFIEGEFQSRLGISLDDSPYRQKYGDGLSRNDGAGSIEQAAWRISGLLTPTDDLEIYGSYEWFDNDSPFKPQTVRGSEYTAYLSTPMVFNQNIETLRGELKYEIADAVEFKAVGGRQKYDHEGLVDLDAGTSRYSPERVNPLPAIGVNPADLITFEQAFSDTWRTTSRSYEFTLSSTYDSPLQWMAGYYNFREDTFRSLWVDLPLNGDGIINFNQPSRVAESEAFFGRLEYAVTDKINISGGLRYTDDSRTDTGVNRFDSFPGGNPLQAFGAPVLIEESGQTELQFLCQGNLAVGPCNPDLVGEIPAGSQIPNVGAIQGVAAGNGGNLRIPGLGTGFGAALGSPIANIQQGVVDAIFASPTVFTDAITTDEQLRDISDVLSEGGELGLVGPAANFPRVFFTDRSSDYVDWQLSIDYSPRDQTFLYATVATGHKAGSQEIFYLPRLTSFVNSILEPEDLISYEVGWKEQFDFGLDLSSTFFFMDYKDKQQSVFVNGGDLFCPPTFGDFNGDGFLESFVGGLGGIPIFQFSAAAANDPRATILPDGQVSLSDEQVQESIAFCTQGSLNDGTPILNTGGPDFVELLQVNFGDAKIAGFEFEFDWDLTDRDRISGYATVNVVNEISDANTDALPFPLIDALACGDRVGGCPSIAAVDGNELPFAPDFTFRLAYEHDFDIGRFGTLTPAVDLTYNSDYFLSVWNVRCYDSIRLGTEVCNNGDYQEGFALLDLRVRYEPIEAPFYIEAYGRNVTNQSYATNAQRPSQEESVTAYTFNDRSLYGVRLVGSF